MLRSFLHLVFTCIVFWVCLVDTIAAIKITGATGGVDLATGARPFRLEINTFATLGAPYDLFVLALRQLQSTNQSSPLSYFQIAGIHGYPQQAWDGVVGGGQSTGYCMHFSPLFSTWHRPYMALYEQAIWNNAQVIARTYPVASQDEYISAARNLRIPYWDWATYPFLPDAATQQSVTITTPDGQATLSNPLYAYTFLDVPENNGIPLGTSGLPSPVETVRYWDPDLQRSNQTAANATLLAQANNIRSYVYNMLTVAENYSTFSYAASFADGSGHNIEYLHGGIHVAVGGTVNGGGTMSWLPVAAFDPIFYLHHANVDRLIAMWQVLNPDSYIVPTVNAGSGSYYELSGALDSGNSSLAPFHSDNGTTLYTSDGVRNTSTFGYTYPELIDWNVSASQLASNVRLAVNTLYNQGALDTSAHDSSTKTQLSPQPLARSAATFAFWHIDFVTAQALHINNLPMSWGISIVVQRYAHAMPFLLDFFMGSPELDPALRSTAPNLIGSHTTLFSGNISAIFPDGAPDTLMQGYVSLSHTLATGVERGVLRDLSPEFVIPVLREMLTWNARGVDGSDINVGELKGLRVRVSSRKVRPARHGAEFPRYGKMRYWDGVTRGKVGGGDGLMRKKRRAATYTFYAGKVCGSDRRTD